MKPSIIFLSIFLAGTALCCPGLLMGLTELGSPQVTHLISNYNLVCQVSGCLIGHSCDNTSCAVYNTYKVIDVDWDRDFMIIKTQQPDDRTLNWYVINIADGKIFGPFSYEEYLDERQTLFVSEQIDLLDPGKMDFEIYGQKH
jgi:hypothetical protein